MSDVSFTLNSKLKPDVLFNHIIDFEFYPNYFPKQIKKINVVKRTPDEIYTEEEIIFSTLVKKPIMQKSIHRISAPYNLQTEISDGPAKGSIVELSIKNADTGSLVDFNCKLKLSLKAKFLEPLIKKFYKSYLTSLIMKINTKYESVSKI